MKWTPPALQPYLGATFKYKRHLTSYKHVETSLMSHQLQSRAEDLALQCHTALASNVSQSGHQRAKHLCKVKLHIHRVGCIPLSKLPVVSHPSIRTCSDFPLFWWPHVLLEEIRRLGRRLEGLQHRVEMPR